jgi:hypothetical protein
MPTEFPPDTDNRRDMTEPGYLQVDLPTLVICGRRRLLEWRIDPDGVERGYDHETETYCVAPGRFPATPGFEQ